MAPPCFSDLGKQAKDVFFKNYYVGHVKLNVKTKAPTGLEFNLDSLSQNDSGNITANFEAKHVLSKYGVTLKEKWKTDNSLASELILEDNFLKGLKLVGCGTFTPHSGKRSANLKGAFKNDFVHMNHEIDWSHNGTFLHSALVVGYQKYLAGVQMSFNPHNNKVTSNNFGIGYMRNDFVVHTNLADGNTFSVSVYQRTDPQTELAISLCWSSKSNATRLSVGTVHALSPATSLRGKINNQAQLGLGLTHLLRPGITLSLGAMIDSKNLSQGPHKFGMGLELNA